MDPDTCYYEMFCHMRDGEYPEAREHALSLKQWLDKGGFYPIKYSQVEVDAYLLSVFRRTVGIQEDEA